MEYLVFPFGKYKGVKLQDLPSTYIVLALEKFDLPEELSLEMGKILYGRFQLYSQIIEGINDIGCQSYLDMVTERYNKYEKL